MSESADCSPQGQGLARGVVPVSGHAVWLPVDTPVYPALWKRWGSAAVDAAILLPSVPFAWWAAWPSHPDPDAIIDTGTFWSRFALLMVVAGWIYRVTLQTGPAGATFGERLLRLRACTMRGPALGWKAATLRYLGGLATLACLGVPLMSCVGSRRLRAWYEALTDTVLVNEPYGHSHVRAYAQRPTLRDASATVVLTVVLSLGWFSIGWPWLASFDERTRVTRAMQSIDDTLLQLQNRALFGKGFPTLEQTMKDPAANFGSIPMGPDAKAIYIGDGRVEVQMLFEPLRGRKVILQAPQAAGTYIQCVYADLPPIDLPMWCKP